MEKNPGETTEPIILDQFGHPIRRKTSKGNSSKSTAPAKRRQIKILERFGRHKWPAAIAFLLSALSLLVFLPRPVVSAPSVPFDPSSALSVSFDVTNNGITKLNDVNILVGVNFIRGPNGRPSLVGVPGFKSRFALDGWQHRQLSMDERITLNLSALIVGQTTSADIAVIVEYQPWILPLRREKVFRFATYQETDGSTHWRSWPTSASIPSR